MKNNNITLKDPNQVSTFEHDENNDAKRVFVVGGDLPIDEDKIANAIKEGLSTAIFNITELRSEIKEIEKNVFLPQVEIKEIEKQVFVPQIEYKIIEVPTITEKTITVEIPKIVRELEVKTIEIPVITEKIITVEIPKIIKEIEYITIEKERYYPKIITICAIAQAMCMIGLLILNIFRKI